MEQFAEARTAYVTALEIYREIGAPLGEASALMNLGNVHFRERKFKDALDMYERTLSIHKEIGNALGQANALTNLGSLFSKTDRHQEAVECAHEARSLYEKVGARTQGMKSVETLIKRLERDGGAGDEVSADDDSGA